MPLNTPRPPIVWSIAGTDSSGGAGLSADLRAADAMGVHLCPVVACVTAQQSQGVEAVFALPADQLDAQLQALAHDMPPRAIKTGLLGSVAAIACVARWVDVLRAQTPTGQDPHRHLALVVDPVLKASAGGAAFSDAAIVKAYRDLLLPRATVITPNRAEARALLGLPIHADEGTAAAQAHTVPDLALALAETGPLSVMVTGGDACEHMQPDAERHVADADGTHSLDWLHTPQAQGWLSAPRVPTAHHHGTGCTLATGIASGWALGHGPADACVLAKMLTHHALMHGHAAGAGRGPVQARTGFAMGPANGGAPLPHLGLGRELPWTLQRPAQAFVPYTAPDDGLYGIVASAEGIGWALQAGLRCLQLRHKSPVGLDAHLPRSLQLADEAGAQLFVNDHWQAALAQTEPTPTGKPDALGACSHKSQGLHLGQEDLLALTAAERAQLCAAHGRVMLGLSSHSVWELSRAAGCGASYIACGPVQATTTKDMPWRPQGMDNLRWWVANSPAPVVAIGGLLTEDDLARFAACNPIALCVVRALGSDLAEMLAALPRLRAAVRLGRQAGEGITPACPPLPHPVL